MDIRKRYVVGQWYLVPHVGEARFEGFDDVDRLRFVAKKDDNSFVYDPVTETAEFRKRPAGSPISDTEIP